jgi:hypothetical protein
VDRFEVQDIMDLLGLIFQKLTQLAGGSELLPLLVFCVLVVLLGLGVGMGAMRLIRGPRSAPEAGAEQSG